MEAVTNTTVLAFLGKIGRLDLLEIFKKIITSPEVRAEVFAKEDLHPTELIVLEDFFKSRIKVIPSKKRLPDLGIGESTAIPLCKEHRIDRFLSDDRKARWCAKALGLKPIGVIGIILENCRQKRISKGEAESIILGAVSNGLYIDAKLLSDSLTMLSKL